MSITDKLKNIKDVKVNKENISHIIKEIEKDSNYIDNYSIDDIMKIKEYCNPYGYIVKDIKNTKFTCLSIINVQQIVEQKRAMISTIGYIQRKLKESNKLSKTSKNIIEKYLYELFDMDLDDTLDKYNEGVYNNSNKPKNINSMESNDGDKVSNDESNDKSNKNLYELKNYQNAHFDDIQMLTEYIYPASNKFELSIQIHGQFDKISEAKSFNIKHQGEMITDMIVIENGNWCFINQCKTNRSKVDLETGQAPMFQSILDHNKEQIKLGEKIIDDRIIEGCAKSKIDNDGDDDPKKSGFNEYLKYKNKTIDSENEINIRNEKVNRIVNDMESNPEIIQRSKENKIEKDITYEKYLNNIKKNRINIKATDQSIANNAPDDAIVIKTFKCSKDDFKTSYMYSKSSEKPL